MGRLDIDPTLQHFSHPHTLKLQNFPSQIPNKPICSSCKLAISGWTYNCNSCNYYLHKVCAQMPIIKKHEIDPNHTLTLISTPAYPQGAFKCNACGRHDTGFSYHCKDCELDLHTLCAHMPSSININHHLHNHTLSLIFSPVYSKKVFQCDICRGFGSNHWLYRCNSCSFDAHLNCAIANTQNQKQDQPAAPASHQYKSKIRRLPLASSVVGSPSRSPLPLTSHHYTRMIHRHPPSPSSFTVGSSSRSPLPVYDQIGGGDYYYTAAGMPVLVGSPPYVQPPRTYNIMNDNNHNKNLTEIVMKGVVDGFAQQAGQILLGSILGGFSFT
ncbi:hypothetical protein JCGZ_25553 [Jatropha curcas]|uniref:DC1 domain-containing protein n=1 Tax=Jatropha curcas TaxID=180498 RepID=A0A067JL49_JATCU|nr:uncharacterized protein LOC105646554 [Jatropha curcas]KDP24637.1 hypothetical protein JCGZ_25553 [Jatropha curcas]